MRPIPIAIAAACTLAVAGCPKQAGLELRSAPPVTEATARESFACVPASVERRFFCTKDRTLLGQELAVLGSVYKVAKVGGACPEPLSAAEKPEAIVPGLDKYALSVTNAVTTQVDFALVKQDVAANVRALAFLEGSLEGEAVASVELLRTTRSVTEDDKFNRAVTELAARHPDACRLYVSTGYAADYFTARVFTSTKAKAGGGVYAVNVGGHYFASDETVKHDYQWAVNIVKIDVGTLNKSEPELTFEAKVTDPVALEVLAFTPPGGLI